LASREHYCIHPTVSKSTNKNEEWFATPFVAVGRPWTLTSVTSKQLLSLSKHHAQADQVQVEGEGSVALPLVKSGEGCSFKAGADRLAIDPILKVPTGDLQMWDIEDLVHQGRYMHGMHLAAAMLILLTLLSLSLLRVKGSRGRGAAHLLSLQLSCGSNY